MTDLTRSNFGYSITQFAKAQNLAEIKVAKVIGCSAKTIDRLTGGRSFPSDEMLRQGGTLIYLGFEKYSKLTKADREKISESIGAIGGGVLGLGSVTAVVSSLGYAGLSAAGIASGLAALGAVVGGGMVAGLTVAAGIPIVAGAVGYGLIKVFKAATDSHQLGKEELDPIWELPLTHR
ncbi:hypothetical protein [Pseudomonas violetae]|uniref:Transcriptional regulator n=1 Tax=Pseudomonas violetae TaxID=2915813 RepID=A0ABT0ESS1_9PSED|nr:hypothetical protein [Pseudomonas violetae]MCK1788783.1 hypothetical protein [Pseudomonas violetae]